MFRKDTIYIYELHQGKRQLYLTEGKKKKKGEIGPK